MNGYSTNEIDLLLGTPSAAASFAAGVLPAAVVPARSVLIRFLVARTLREFKAPLGMHAALDELVCDAWPLHAVPEWQTKSDH